MKIFSSLRQFMRIYQSPAVLIFHYHYLGYSSDCDQQLDVCFGNRCYSRKRLSLIFYLAAYYYRSFILGFRYPAYCSLFSSAGSKALLSVGFRLFFTDSGRLPCPAAREITGILSRRSGNQRSGAGSRCTGTGRAIRYSLAYIMGGGVSLCR